jgi:hypothetical protein
MPGAQHLFAIVGHQDDFAGKHIDEFVVERVPMAQRRLSSGSECHQVDAEFGEAAGISEASFHAIAHARTKRFGIPRSALLGDGGAVDDGKLQHDSQTFFSVEREIMHRPRKALHGAL